MSLDKRPRRRHHQSCPLFPPRSPAAPPMELEGQARPSRSCRLLLPAGPPDADEDEGEVVISIRPKCSPLPRRRSSISDEDSEPELPPCASRRVSFADAKGLSLVQVKEFDLWDVPNPPGMDLLDGEGVSAEEYRLSPLTFQSPLSPDDLLVRVQEQKIELESLELIPGTTTLRGLVCVLNMSFHKAVYVRTTLDCWASHFDLLTEYVPAASGDARTDRFSFKLTLVPPFREQGSRVDFCLRYETPAGTFWANNDNRNYVLLCHQRSRQLRENPHKQNSQKKSCLKTARPDSQNFVDDTWETPTSLRIQLEGGATNGEKVDNEQVVQLLDQSEEDKNNLQAEFENRQNCSRRNRRKAARMARLRDYFETDAVPDDESDASSHPEDEQIPVGDQADVQFMSEEEPKLEGCYGVMGKTFGDVPARQDETQAHNEAQTPEDTSLASLMRGKASTDASSDEPPPTEHCNTFVSEAEETNGTCQNRSDSFTFEAVASPLCRPMLRRSEDDRTCPERTEREDNREVQENLIRNKNLIPLESTFQKLVHDDVDQKASLKRSNRSDTDEFAMKPTGHTRDHAIKNNTEDRVDAELKTENSTWNGEEGATETKLSAERNSNVMQIHKDLDLPSGVSHPIQVSTRLPMHELSGEAKNVVTRVSPSQNLLRDNADHQTSLGRADWSNADDSVARGTENLQSREQILEDVLENATQHCLDDNLNVPIPEDDTWNGTQTNISLTKSSNTDMALPSGGSQTTQVPTTMPTFEPLSGTKTDDPLPAPFQSQPEPVSDHVHQQASFEPADWSETEDAQNCDQLEENVIRNSTEECFDADLDVTLPEDAWNRDGYANESQLFDQRHTDSPSEPVSLDHADGSEVENSVVGSTSMSSETFNHTKVFRIEVTDRAQTQESARRVLGTQGETCCIGDERWHNFQKGEDEMTEALTYDDHSQYVSFFEDEANISQSDRSAAETDDAQKLETKVEDEDVDDAVEIQECPGIDKPHDLEEETEMAEEPEDVGEAEERFAEKEEGKIKVVMWDEEVKDEDAKLVDKERVVNPDDEEQKIPGDDAEGKDVRSEFDQNNLKDAPSYQREADGAVGRNPEDTNVHDDEDKTDEIEDGQTESDDASAESDSDDEVELYMHCLRAVQTKDQSAEATFSLSKTRRLSPLSSPMPSISESADEEHVGCLEDSREDARAENAARSRPSEPESAGKNVAGRENRSCGCTSKTLLYVTLLAVFVVTAYYYDFLACFGLYLISVVWLLSQGEKQPIQDNSVG
ncbi:uncharacterized protein ppp1r3ab isoform X2 [Festucalex cinctus]